MNVRGWISALKRHDLPTQMTTLVGVMLLSYGCILPWTVGQAGVVAASLAASTCLAAASTALLLSHWVGRPSNGLAPVLLPMMARTAPPLFLALIVRLRGHGLVEMGFVHYLMGFYLLALFVELPMSLPRVERSWRCSGAAKQEGGKPHG